MHTVEAWFKTWAITHLATHISATWFTTFAAEILWSRLIEQSTDLNEYAFALGALAHYASDNMGHPTINKVVAISFPKLRKKFGDEVTYADNHKAHIQTEFGFDMVQVAKNRYTSDRYHDFIGFDVSKPVLERAFVQTYDLQVTMSSAMKILLSELFAAASALVIPEMTRVALAQSQ